MKLLTLFVALLALIALAIGADALSGSLTSESTARHALEVQGFSHIHAKGRDILFVQVKGCGREDAARYTFAATNPAGRHVTVYVCEGWPFKGATVRYP